MRPTIHSKVRNDNVQKDVKIWNFAKDRSHENYQIFDKILTQNQTYTNPSNKQKNTLEYNFGTNNSITSQKGQCSKFSIYDKILTQPRTSTNPSNQRKKSLEYHF